MKFDFKDALFLCQVDDQSILPKNKRSRKRDQSDIGVDRIAQAIRGHRPEPRLIQDHKERNR